jgi:hypothetical protein
VYQGQGHCRRVHLSPSGMLFIKNLYGFCFLSRSRATDPDQTQVVKELAIWPQLGSPRRCGLLVDLEIEFEQRPRISLVVANFDRLEAGLPSRAINFLH